MGGKYGQDEGFTEIFATLKKCLLDLNYQYTLSKQETLKIQNAMFALGIVNCLLNNKGILNYVNQLIKQDLSDSIGLHHAKYVDILEDSCRSAEALELREKSKKLLDMMEGTSRKKNLSISEKEALNIIKEITTNIAQKCRGLFAEQAYNQEAIDKLQAAAIAFNIDYLSITDRLQFFEKVLMIKELWQFENNKNSGSNDFRLTLHLQLSNILKQIKANTPFEAFLQLVNFLVDEKRVIEELSNNFLINLYDRLKNYQPRSSPINDILNKLHHEAQFRYTYNRLNDAGYELLKRFQSYDAILHQIDISETALIETFLLKNKNFTQEVLIFLAKHIDNIRVVGAEKVLKIGTILNFLKEQLENRHLDKNSTLSNMFFSIKNKLESEIEPYIIKRYSELDNFCINSLKNKYSSLLENVSLLMDKDTENDKDFIEQVIVRKLAQDYYIPNQSNSISKLRHICKERTFIAKSLKEINFVELFNPEHLNYMTSFNFKKQLNKTQVKNPDEYIASIINIIITNASASQLEALYRPLVNKPLTPVSAILKKGISNEVKKRTTFTKTLYSLFSGKKREIKTLKNIKEYFNFNHDENTNSLNLNEIKNLPEEMESKLKDLSSTANKVNIKNDFKENI